MTAHVIHACITIVSERAIRAMGDADICSSCERPRHDASVMHTLRAQGVSMKFEHWQTRSNSHCIVAVECNFRNTAGESLVESCHLSHNLHTRSRHRAKLCAQPGGRSERELQDGHARQGKCVMDIHTIACS